MGLKMKAFKTTKFAGVLFLGISCLWLLPSNALAAKKIHKKRYVVTAKSAILSNTTKPQRLYGKNAYLKVAPASTTKVMTALLVLERLPLDKVIEVSRRATLVAPTKAGLKAGERYTVADLLCAALMQSANDASVVLAEAVAGSESQFVELMNRRAKELGAKMTRFANPNGLPTKESQYTTAYDMMLIFKEALKYPFFKETLSRKNKAIFSDEGRKITITSYNKLLWKNWRKTIYGKTGYTRKAKHCFIGYFEANGKTFIVGVFGCSRRWQDIQHIITKYGGVRL